jgi:hypothetical protein
VVVEARVGFDDHAPARSPRVSCTGSASASRWTRGCHAPSAVFVTLYEQGLIYRDRYLINWCPRCRTALSDLERSIKTRRESSTSSAIPMRMVPVPSSWQPRAPRRS